MKPTSFAAGNAKSVAHRGLSGLYPENSVEAFREAAKLPYFGIETDVDVTADGHFVLMHDHTTGRTGDRDLPVRESTLAALSEVRLLGKDGLPREDLRVPMLRDYLDICREGDKVCVLELKVRFTEDEVARILAEVDAAGCRDRMLYISFFMENLDTLRKLDPDCTGQFLISQWTEELLPTLIEKKMDLDIHYGALDEEKVRAVLDAGLTLNVWTVDDPATAETLAAWGVHQITSNILLGE